jgi:DNA-binding CsgD family transcriptional regulator
VQPTSTPDRQHLLRHHLAEGQAALTQGRWLDARASFEQVLGMAEVPEALEGRGLAAWWLDDAAATFDSRAKAYRLYREAGNARGAARVACAIGFDTYLFRGERAVANGWLERAHQLLEDLGPVPERGWLLIAEAHMALLPDHDAGRAERLAGQAADLGHTLGIVDLEMLGRAYRGLALVSQGRVDEGMRLLDGSTAAALAGEITDPDALCSACCCLIYACERIRDYARAEQWCHELQRLSERWSYRVMFAVCRVHYAGVLVWHGRWDEAEATLVEATELMLATKPAEAAQGFVQLARLRCRQGRLEEAEQILRRVQAPPLHMLAQPDALLARAELRCAAGDVAASEEFAEAYLRAVSPGELTARAQGLEVLVHARAARADLTRVAQAVEELQRLAREVGTLPLRAAAALAAGELAAANGDHARAAESLEEAVALFARSGAPFETARARVALAECLHVLGRIDRAAEELAEARREFERLGARLEVRRVAAVRARLSAPAPAARAGPGAPLSAREIEVLRLVAQGLSNEQIAARLALSLRTVERHLSNVYVKIGAAGRSARAAGVAFAVAHKLT